MYNGAEPWEAKNFVRPPHARRCPLLPIISRPPPCTKITTGKSLWSFGQIEVELVSYSCSASSPS